MKEKVERKEGIINRLIVNAPLRISLFGGGTDVGEYAQKYGGVCINMAVNMEQKLSLWFNNRDSASREQDISDIPKDADINFYRAFFDEFDIYPDLNQEFGDFIRSGLGSSASCAVCLVKGLSMLKGQNLSCLEIAKKAWEIEVNKLDLFGGKQDQCASSFGGFNLMRFEGDNVEVRSIDRKVAESVAKYVLLFDTGLRREKTTIQEGLRVITEEQRQALDVIKQLANDAYHRIYRGDIEGLGELLSESWRQKKKSNSVSLPKIDEIYDKAIDLGAYGGKLLGSGGGGMMIFIVPSDRQEEFKNHLGLKWIDYGGINWNGVVARYE